MSQQVQFYHDFELCEDANEFEFEGNNNIKTSLKSREALHLASKRLDE